MAPAIKGGKVASAAPTESFGHPSKCFRVIRPIGQGAMGTALLVDAQHRSGGATIRSVLKRVDLSSQSDWGKAASRQEAKMLKSIIHPFILHCEDAWEHGGYLYMQAEWCPKGDLSSCLLQKKKTLREQELKQMLAQALLSLQFPHKLDIIHRDIKPENLLMGPDGRIRVADFNMASFKGSSPAATVGTVGYLSPEMTRGVKYGCATDIWSLGVTFLELTNMAAPFLGRTSHVHSQVLNFRVPQLTQHGYSAAWKALLGRMLQLDPARRATAEQLLKEPYLAQAVSMARKQLDLNKPRTLDLAALAPATASPAANTVPNKVPAQPQLPVASVAPMTQARRNNGVWGGGQPGCGMNWLLKANLPVSGNVSAASTSTTATTTTNTSPTSSQLQSSPSSQPSPCNNVAVITAKAPAPPVCRPVPACTTNNLKSTPAQLKYLGQALLVPSRIPKAPAVMKVELSNGADRPQIGAPPVASTTPNPWDLRSALRQRRLAATRQQ